MGESNLNIFRTAGLFCYLNRKFDEEEKAVCNSQSVNSVRCETCKAFFYFAIQTYFTSEKLVYEILDPLFLDIYPVYLECKSCCKSEYCIKHFVVFVDKVNQFSNIIGGSFRDNKNLRAALSTLFYCLNFEFNSCSQRHGLTAVNVKNSRHDNIWKLLESWSQFQRSFKHE